MMIMTLLEISGTAGFYGLAFIAVAWAAWELGVRDPLLLTVLALVLGALIARGLVLVYEKVVPDKSAAGE